MTPLPIAHRPDLDRPHLKLKLKLSPEHAVLPRAALTFDSVMRDKLVATFLGHIRPVGENRSPAPLYTSDHPLVKHTHVGAGFAGLASPEIDISLPISPWHSMINVEPEAFGRLGLIDWQTVDLQLDHVNHRNSL